MTHNLRSARRPAIRISSSAAIALLVGALWGVHAAGLNFPGFLRLGLLLVSAFILIVLRLHWGHPRFRFPHAFGLTTALGAWFIAATLSAILHYQTDQVLVTYFTVFLVGGIVFVALSGITLEPRYLDLAVAGLAIGSLVTLVSGLLAFMAEWGVPDLPTVLSAYREVLRMSRYEQVTFGNRGNTAAFVVIIAPVLLTTLLDRRKRLALRVLCGITVAAIAFNLMILEVRAALIVVTVAVALVWLFRFGLRHLPLFAVGFAICVAVAMRFSPDISTMLNDQLLPAMTVDTEGDVSVSERVIAIHEGWQIAQDHWLLGIGPGAALSLHSHDSAHQFQVQQAMELGMLGLFGSTLFSIAVLAMLLRTLQGGRNERNSIRFLLLSGPAAYVLYAILANATLGFGNVNTWTVLVLSMLALVPEFEPRRRWMPVKSVVPMNVRFDPELCQ